MSKKSLTTRTINGAIWLFMGSGAQTLLNLLVTIALARLIDPVEFGVVGAALIVVGFSQNFSQIGIGPAVVQRSELTDTHVHVGFTLSFIFGCLIGILIFSLSPLIAQFFKMSALLHVIQTLSVLFPITAVSVITEALMQRDMKYKSLSAVMVISYAFGYGFVGIALAYAGKGVWALVYAQLSQALFKTLILLALRPRIFRLVLRKREACQLLYFGSGFSVARVANYLANQSDNFVVGRWLGPDSLGIYGRAYQIMMLPANLLGKVADTALFPAMASLQGDPERIGRSYVQAISIVVMLVLPLTGVIIVLAPEIVTVVLGDKWVAAVIPLQILASVTVFRTGYKISDTLARALGAVYQHSWRQCVYAGSVFSGALFGQFWGLIGVTLGVSVAILINFFLMLNLSLILTKVTLRQIVIIFGRHLFSAIIVTTVTIMLKRFLEHFNVHPFLVLICGVIAVSVLLIVVWFSLPKIYMREIALFRSIFRKNINNTFNLVLRNQKK